MIGGQQEEKKLTRLNYEEELKVFLDSDINRTSWWDRYAIDSSLTQGQLTAVSYKAQTEDLKTRWIELQFSNGKVRAILIENESQSPAVNFFQQLRYIPEEGFFIFTRQKVTLSPPKEMKVEVIFE